MSKEKKQNWYTNQRKYHFIYKTICQVNGKFYYGMHSTDNLEDGYVGSGTRLWHSIRKHGRENFRLEILEYLPNRESLKKREAELITEEMLRDPMCMNLKYGGEGGWNLMSEQVQRRSKTISKQRKKAKNYLITKSVHSLGGKSVISKNRLMWAGKHTDEAKANIGKANSIKQFGSGNSQYGTCWIYHELIGNKKCKKELLPEYLEQGWMKGRK